MNVADIVAASREVFLFLYHTQEKIVCGVGHYLKITYDPPYYPLPLEYPSWLIGCFPCPLGTYKDIFKHRSVGCTS